MKPKIKLNRGAVLFCVIAVLVVIYLIITGVLKSGYRDDIMKSAGDFVKATDKYMLLPKADGKSANDEAVAAVIDDMKKDVSRFYIDDPRAYANVVSAYSEIIGGNAASGSEYTEYSSSLLGENYITELQFDGLSKATLLIAVKTEYTKNGISDSECKYNTTFVFEKNDGKWLLLYTNYGSMQSENDTDGYGIEVNG